MHDLFISQNNLIISDKFYKNRITSLIIFLQTH